MAYCRRLLLSLFIVDGDAVGHTLGPGAPVSWVLEGTVTVKGLMYISKLSIYIHHLNS